MLKSGDIKPGYELTYINCEGQSATIGRSKYNRYFVQQGEKYLLAGVAFSPALSQFYKLVNRHGLNPEVEYFDCDICGAKYHESESEYEVLCGGCTAI